MKNCNYINWSKVSNFWEVFEEMGISPRTIKDFSGQLKSPILVMGAGLGIVPEYLSKIGYTTDSLECTPEMAKKCKERRNIGAIISNATKTRLKDSSYNTVLINTGVIDTLNLCTTFVPKLLKETNRVLKDNGNAIISFFREKPNMEFIYESLGLNKVPSNYYLFLEKNLRDVKSGFIKKTRINPNLIDFIFNEYHDFLLKLHSMVLRIGKTLKSKKIEPCEFISKYLGYEKFDFNECQEKYLENLVRKSFGKIREKRLLSDNETCIIVARNSCTRLSSIR